MAKIIAKAERSNYLVEMTGTEIAQILGPGYIHQVGDAALKTGAEIPVGEIWSRYNHLGRIQRTLSGAAGELRQVADWLDTVPPLVEPPEEKKPAKKEATKP